MIRRVATSAPMRARDARCAESTAFAVCGLDLFIMRALLGAGVVLTGSTLALPSVAGDAQSASGTASAQAANGAQSTKAKSGATDELPNAGYVPGYRLDKSLGMSPYTPRVGALPGGMTPGYGAPMPSNDWSFKWSGFMNASLQFSTNQRPVTGEGQSQGVVHVPPQTVDEYASFIGTSTMPGNWVQMAFVYGNPQVSANLSLTTWNPTTPTTFYQIGSQNFINNAYLAFEIPPFAGIGLRANVGYFYNVYGSLAQYGLGMYTNPLIGGARGVGENLTAEIDLSDTISLVVEDGIMGMRNGKGPSCPSNLAPNPAACLPVTTSSQNGSGNPNWPSAWMHHVHVGIQKKGDVSWRVRAHAMINWAQDERSQRIVDDPTTRQTNEAFVKDGKVEVYGVDAHWNHPVWGYVGVAASYTRGQNAYPVKGLVTFGGEGDTLTNRWWGQTSNGSGALVAAGINYTASLGKILSHPVPFTPGPDLLVSAGFVMAHSTSDSAFDPFDGRLRHKYGLDLQYNILPVLSVGLRCDRVVPSSKDSDETFHVLSPRLIFKGDWDSRYTISAIYGKWFYGSHTHPEGSSVTPGDRLDDQLFALSAQMWW